MSAAHNPARRTYGTWPSPLTTQMMAGERRLLDVGFTREGDLYWLERGAGQAELIVDSAADGLRTINPAGLSISGGVGYGGGETCALPGAIIAAGTGGRLYRLSLTSGAPVPITPLFGASASPAVSPDGRFVVFVHSLPAGDALAIVDSRGRHYPKKLVDDAGFVMQPVWHPDGDRIAFLSWSAPHMPWDFTALREVRLKHETGELPVVSSIEPLSVDDGVSVFQPAYSPDGRYLAYVSDRAGYWQVWLRDLQTQQARPLVHDQAEYAEAAWVQGQRTIGWQGNEVLLALRTAQARTELVRIPLRGKPAIVAGLEAFTDLRQLAISPDGNTAAVIASAPTRPERIVTVNLPAGQSRVRRQSASVLLPSDALATGEAIEWPGEDGEPRHGVFYPPPGQSEGVERPPLIAIAHSGPTSHVPLAYSAEAQFFATRGYAVLYVNYQGSTGYGRAYRERGYGAWGEADVADTRTGALALAERGLVDPARRAILGSSAGGLTVLQSLAMLPGFWTAGISRYGVSDHFALAREAPFRFEAHYSDTLLGPLPEFADRYRERSPLHHADRIRDPLLMFHGDEDGVVPLAQSDALVERLRALGRPVEYHVFAGEGHGFRKPETIERYLTLTLAFLERHLVYGG